MMKPATISGLLNAEAKSLYKAFNESLRLIKEVTDPTVKAMWERDLLDIWNRAKQLLDTGELNTQVQPMMTIITSRSHEQWVIVTKGEKNPLVPLW
jgi:hypothetical protein